MLLTKKKNNNTMGLMETISADKILESAQHAKTFLSELLKVVSDIFGIIFRYKLISLFLLACFTIYCILYFLAYEQPLFVVKHYYEYVDTHHTDNAWVLLTPSFQSSRWINSTDFKDGYTTACSTKIKSVSISKKDNILSELWESNKVLDVEIVVIENFRQEDIVDSIGNERRNQRDNILLLKLKHGDNKLTSLKSDTLKNYTQSLQLVKRVKKLFFIRCDGNLIDRFIRNKWVIYNIHTKEASLIDSAGEI